MKPPPFRYLAPNSLEEALELIAEHGDTGKILAGGQSLIPTMNFRLAQPDVLIDLNGLTSLSYIEQSDDGGLRIGAMTRQESVLRSELVKERAPLLFDAMPFIAHPQIRNRGTIGGSIVHADPAAELPALMVALRAVFKMKSGGGERLVEAESFFQGMFAIDLEPDEILTEIRIPPLPERSGWAFKEVSRRHGDYALMGAACLVTLDEQGACSDARIVFLSAGDRPILAENATDHLIGHQPDAERIQAAAQSAAEEDIEPDDDIHATVAYRKYLARTLTVELLEQSFVKAP